MPVVCPAPPAKVGCRHRQDGCSLITRQSLSSNRPLIPPATASLRRIIVCRNIRPPRALHARGFNNPGRDAHGPSQFTAHALFRPRESAKAIIVEVRYPYRFNPAFRAHDTMGPCPASTMVRSDLRSGQPSEHIANAGLISPLGGVSRQTQIRDHDPSPQPAAPRPAPKPVRSPWRPACDKRNLPRISN